jgi:hypothetical protein
MVDVAGYGIPFTVAIGIPASSTSSFPGSISFLLVSPPRGTAESRLYRRYIIGEEGLTLGFWCLSKVRNGATGVA